MKEFLISLFYEAGVPSWTRVMSLVGLLLFILATLYLMISEKVFAHYDTFAYITGGGALGVQVMNKFINSKYNSITGEHYKKGG